MGVGGGVDEGGVELVGGTVGGGREGGGGEIGVLADWRVDVVDALRVRVPGGFLAGFFMGVGGRGVRGGGDKARRRVADTGFSPVGEVA